MQRDAPSRCISRVKWNCPCLFGEKSVQLRCSASWKTARHGARGDVHPFSCLRVLKCPTHESCMPDAAKTGWMRHWVTSTLQALHEQHQRRASYRRTRMPSNSRKFLCCRGSKLQPLKSAHLNLRLCSKSDATVRRVQLGKPAYVSFVFCEKSEIELRLLQEA